MAGSEQAEAVVTPCVGKRDWLVRWSTAAQTLGRSEKTLDGWFEAGNVPAVRTPGGQLSTYASWLTAVMLSARRGRAGDIKEVTDAWWTQHEVLRAGWLAALAGEAA